MAATSSPVTGAVAAAGPAAGGWFTDMEADDIDLPLARPGIRRCAGLMALVIWLAHRHRRVPAQRRKQ